MLSAKLSHLLEEGIFTYSITVGFFILSMGLGSFLQYKKNLKSKQDIFKNFIMIEILMILMVSLCIFIIEGITAIYMNHVLAILLGGFCVIGIGFVTGQELPLLFSLIEANKADFKVQRKIIFFDYLASFGASLFCTFLFFPYLGPLKTSALISFINFLVLILIYKVQVDEGLSTYKSKTPILVFFSLYFFVFFIDINGLEHTLHERNYEFFRNDTLISKLNTPYQQVLLFAVNNKTGKRVSGVEEVVKSPQDYSIHAHLNGSIQFVNQVGIKDDPYHTYLMDSFFKLEPKRKEVLIMGGGDGLPARQVLQYPQVEKIEMVDLDEDWINFTRTNPVMRLNTHDSLNSPRIKIYFSDAFKWMNHSKKIYDFVIVDFPEDFNLATIRTVSVQFFNDLKRSLTDHGVVVLQDDFDSKPDRELLQYIYNTAHKAQIYPLIGRKSHSNILQDYVVQVALFKTKEARDKYLSSFQQQYISDESNELLKKYGHINYYTDFDPDDSGYISFYNPIILSKIFRPNKETFSMIWTMLFNPQEILQ